MNVKTTEWLMAGPAWLRYAVELQLLGKKPKPTAALADPEIAAIRERLQDRERGIPALIARELDYKSSGDSGNAYWDLFFLADIGLRGRDLGLDEAVERLLGLQASDGTYPIWSGMKPNFFCISSILLSTLVKLEYGKDPRLARHIDVILDTQRLDGGWHCTKARAVGERLQHAESCPMDNLNILMLVGQYEQYRNDKRFDGAIELLLNHWERQAEHWRPMGFGIGSEFLQLRYPAVKYGILRVLDVLSHWPRACADKRFKDMLRVVQGKAVDGKYTAEAMIKTFGTLEFSQKKQPSRWLTFVVNRIEKRAAMARS